MVEAHEHSEAEHVVARHPLLSPGVGPRCLQGKPDIGRRLRPHESFGEHPHHLVSLVSDPQHPTHHSGVSSPLRGPQAVAHEGYRLRVGSVVFGLKPATEERLHPDQGKPIPVDPKHPHACRRLALTHRLAQTRGTCGDPGGQPCGTQRLDIGPPEGRQGRNASVFALDRLAQKSYRVRIVDVFGGAEQKAVGHPKDGGVGTQPQGQSHHNRRRKAGRAAEASGGRPNSRHDDRERAPSTLPSASASTDATKISSISPHVTEPASGLGPRLGLTQTPGLEQLHRSLEMRLELRVDLPPDVVGPRITVPESHKARPSRANTFSTASEYRRQSLASSQSRTRPRSVRA